MATDAAKKKKEQQALRNELVEERPSRIVGRGLFAKVPFGTGEVVCALVGRIAASSAEMTTEEADYAMEGLRGYLVPDIASAGGHLACHSCRPNARFGDWAGETLVLPIYASRAIRPGDEITVYYGWSGWRVTECKCGERTCFGLIGARFEWEEKWPHLTGSGLVDLLANFASNRNVTGLRVLLPKLTRQFEVDPRSYDECVRRVIATAPLEDARWLASNLRIDLGSVRGRPAPPVPTFRARARTAPADRQRGQLRRPGPG
jgi:hypothetical protein